MEERPLFVGNLDRSIEQKELEGLFEDEGFKVVKLGMTVYLIDVRS
jgi:hypothetical protein